MGKEFMVLRFSLEMESSGYTDDVFLCDTEREMISYCNSLDICIDGVINRIARVSIDAFGRVDMVYQFYRIEYHDIPDFPYFVPVNYNGTDM